jgi:hypothetical protein
MFKFQSRSANGVVRRDTREIAAQWATGLLMLCVMSCAIAKDVGWPREKSNAAGALIYYQPQLDEWKDFRRLEARMAVSIKPAGGQPTLGVVTFRARTDANLETRNVVISRLEIISVRFPSLDENKAAAMETLVRSFLPASGTLNIDLDRLLAALDASKPAATPVVAVKNDPPVIFVTYEKAILLLVDGDTVRAPIKGTDLEFVVNTNWNVFFDTAASKYYLLNERQWLVAGDLAGPWKVTTQLPKGMSNIPNQPNWEDVKKAIPPPSGAGRTAPQVFYSNKPAEIISFTGQPKFVNIANTQLAYASNTESDLFRHNGEKKYYFLVAGRWFRAQSLSGPWSYASADLPPDFALIPPHSAQADVLASVPGTEEANDAVLLAQVPNTVIVDPAQAEAQVKVAYDGAPQFKPIETTNLSYASNTQDKVIKIGDLYYLCFQGVWFMSTGPEGPWKTAASVPREIYTIPPSSPVYNVTYVTQTTTPSGEIEASSTAGYFGAFIIGVTVGAIVSHGSGYYYPPYYYYGPYPYPIYRPYPITYGVGAFYNPRNGTYGYARGAYGPYGGVAGAAWYNPSRGTYGRAVGGCGVYGCAGAARAYNPYTGAYGATRQGSNAYSQWGSSVVTKGDKWAQTAHYSDARGTISGARTSEGGRVVAGNGPNGRGFVGQSGAGDVYAGKDGNVYKKTDSGWQQYQNGGWNSAGSATPRSTAAQATRQPAVSSRPASTQPSRTPPQPSASNTLPTQRPQPSAAQRPQPGAATTSSNQFQDLNRDAQSRQAGNERARNFQNSNQGSRGAPAARGRRR